MKVTLVNLPADFLIEPKSIYPLGLLSMATIFQYLGADVEVLDLGGMRSKGALLSRVREIKSDITGFSAVTAQYKWLKELSGKVPGYSVVGGPHASHEPASVLSLGFSAVVVGEGERAAQRILSKDEGVLDPGPVKNLDELPLVNRSLVRGYKGAVPLMAGRGCPFCCNFCAKSKGNVRTRSINKVIDEIKSISDDHIIFYDDTLTYDREWISQLCFRIKAEGIEKNFRCSTRADRVDLDILKQMKIAGFRELAIGLESGNQDILDTLNKREILEDISYAVYMCHVTGLRVKIFVMLGCPGETAQTIENTRIWLKEHTPDSLGLYILRPLPGSHIWSHPEEYDLEFEKNYGGFYGGRPDEIVSTVSTAALSREDITAAYRDMLKEFKEKV